MQRDASRGMPDQGRPGSHRRHSQTNSGRRPPASQPSSSGRPYTLNSTSNSADVVTQPSTGFQGPPSHYPTASSPYGQQGYVRQYAMSPQPHMSLGHTPPPYSYPQFHHPGVSDAMVPQNIHANYQSMLQPPTPVYQFQRHSPEGASASNTYPAAGPSYPLHQPSPPPHSPQSPGGQNSPSYVGTGQFHSLRYPSPLSAPQYAYSPQAFPTSPPMYPSQYAPTPYPQHYVQPSEPEGQGTWWYLPHAHTTPLASPQYDGGQQPYPGYQPLPYSPVSRHDMGQSYTHSGGQPSASSSTTQTTYPPHLQSGHNSIPSSPVPVSPLPKEPSVTSSDRPVARRSYHPNPPANRSEWVMWAGNVPSDANHEELWKFFNQFPPDNSTEDILSCGVVSIFLISRSNCAFINFQTEAHLNAAISRFNGQFLRPGDPRCPKLVCRARRKDDDLKAGVGGQRGMGMHTRWIKDQQGKMREKTEAVDDPSPSLSYDPSTSRSGSSDQLAPAMSSMSLSSDEEGRRLQGHSSSSGSYASTNSSLLTKFFPQRYFILKSLTQVIFLYLYPPIIYLHDFSMIWILAWRKACGPRRSITRVSWTKRIGLVKRFT